MAEPLPLPSVEDIMSDVGLLEGAAILGVERIHMVVLRNRIRESVTRLHDAAECHAKCHAQPQAGSAVSRNATETVAEYLSRITEERLPSTREIFAVLRCTGLARAARYPVLSREERIAALVEAERLGILVRVAHKQPCEIEGCVCCGEVEWFQFPWCLGGPNG